MSGVSLYQFLSRRILYAGGYYMLENFVLGGKRLGELNKNAGGFCSGRKMSWEDRKNNQEENFLGVFCHGKKKRLD